MLSYQPDSLNNVKDDLNTVNTVDLMVEQFVENQSVYFSSKQYGLLAKGPFANLLVAGKQTLSDQVNDSLDFAKELGFTHAIAIGAIPFDTDDEPVLSISTNYKQHTYKATATKSLYFQDPHITPLSIKQVPSHQLFKDSVDKALHKFATTPLQKVVLSRTLNIKAEEKIDIQAVLNNLATDNHAGYTFAVSLPEMFNSHKTLIGASPELLIRKHQHKITANPLAGSIPRSEDPIEDQRRADNLLKSAKDLYEHALVIESIESVLSPICKVLDVPKQPSLIKTETMWHLSTYIEGELNDPAHSSLDVALAMHPTPAVCGYPTDLARDAIKELESYDRELFTGMVGWCNREGDGEWVVTIRCAQIEDNHATVYAGAGVVEGSTPEKELHETSAKFKTMLNALGLTPEHNVVL